MVLLAQTSELENGGKSKRLEYKGYKGSVEYSLKDRIFFGKVLGIQDLVSYEGGTMDELMADFQESVDLYLEMQRSLEE